MKNYSGAIALASTIVWFIITAYGTFINFITGAPNSDCYPYLGCSAGFFGYDAIEHFLFGFTTVWIIVWLCGKFQRFSILNETYWKTAITLVALFALTGVCWEIIEYSRDSFLINVLHQTLINVHLHTNHMLQPSNSDTMGDLAFGLIGAITAVSFLHPKLKSLTILVIRPKMGFGGIRVKKEEHFMTREVHSTSGGGKQVTETNSEILSHGGTKETTYDKHDVKISEAHHTSDGKTHFHPERK